MKHKQMIICEQEHSRPEMLRIITSLFQKLDMQISYMSSEEHDRHIAYVSHLSHISSFALGLTVLEKEKDEKSIFAMAGSGFSSTVRLAKSSPDMWAPIFDQNAANISVALEAYIKQLNIFKEIIDQGATEKSYELMEKANDIRRILMGIEKG
jgi:prephenate dehydrogenase